MHEHNRISLQKMNDVEFHIEYEENGLMKYHHLFHPNQGLRYSDSDLEYLCKYYEVDGIESMAMGLGRSPKSIVQKVYVLKKQKIFEMYKNRNSHWN
ncbi:DNA-entry nuclease [Metabacillus herbersteinensis]|uniref:DNA-entry nuclease n=1 Tax=Metabacillus herbersteinensis TaxID=283816 RepID=UPI00366C38C3